MKLIILMMTAVLMLGACDRSKGKGSDVSWQKWQESQQRQEEHPRHDTIESRDKDTIRDHYKLEQLQRKYERQHNYFGPK